MRTVGDVSGEVPRSRMHFLKKYEIVVSCDSCYRNKKGQESCAFAKAEKFPENCPLEKCLSFDGRIEKCEERKSRVGREQWPNEQYGRE